DAAVVEGREIVTRRPGARGELLAEQVIASREALEADVAVAVVFVADDVEIIEAAHDWKTRAPPVLDALELDEAAGVEAADLVDAAAERRFERGLVELVLAVIGLREDRQAGDEQRHVAAALFGKAHRDGVLGRSLRAFAVAQKLRDDRVAFFLERVDRPRCV